MNLFKIMVYLESQVNESFSQSFEKKLHTLQPPDIVMDIMFQKICQMDNEVKFFSNLYVSNTCNLFMVYFVYSFVRK